MRLKCFLAGVAVWLCTAAYAQHPSSVKWGVVDLPHVKIIFDKDINQADISRLVYSFEKVFAADTVSLKDNPRRIPLVVSNTEVVSNGYVTLFPYKMYWYGLPYYDNSIGIGEWYQNLAVHEYRHVVQNQILNHGFTKLSGILLGAYGRSAMRMSVPNWWFEGDAVYAETVLTSGGRGRLSSFNMLTAAIITSRNKPYSYDKMVNGSFRNKIPTIYQLGYPLVTHGRRIAGADVWTKTARRSSWYSFWPWSFGSSFKHFAGVNLAKNYKQTMNELRNLYNQRNDSLAITEAKTITQKHSRRYTSYTNAKFIDNNHIVALKSSLTELNTIVSLSLNGEETDLFTTEASSFDYADGKIIWATAVPDIRWTFRGYSDIAIYDLATQKRYRVTNKGRYFSPTISPDGKMIAAVEFDKHRNTSLVLFKAEFIGNKISSLHKIKQIPTSYGEYLRSVHFVNNHEVAAVSNLKNQNAIVIYDLVSSQPQVVKDYESEVINSIKPFNGIIYYDSEYSGISNIWALDISSGNCKMITSRRYSASAPDVSPDGHTFIYSDFSVTGSNIVSASLSNVDAVDISNVKPYKLDYFKPLAASEPYQQLDVVANAPTDINNSYTVKDYKRYYNLIRCYGWMPEFMDGKYGGTIYSENTLQTFQLFVNQIYRTDADIWRTTVGATYSGFYPVLGVSASFNTDADKYYFRNPMGEVYSRYLHWDSKVLNFSVSVPFDFSRYNWSQHLTLSSQLSRYMISNKLTDTYIDMGNDEFSVVYGGVSYSLYRALAYRDFRSSLGFSITVDALKSVNCHRNSQKFKTLVSVTVPGLFRQNSLTVNAGYMQQVRNNDQKNIYLYSDSDLDVLGYKSVRCHQNLKVSGDYAFPLGYPDLGIPAVVWVKRLRGSVFAQASAPLMFGYRYNFASAGFKFICDVNLLRIANNVSLGFSYAKPLIINDYSDSRFDFILTYQM